MSRLLDGYRRFGQGAGLRQYLESTKYSVKDLVVAIKAAKKDGSAPRSFGGTHVAPVPQPSFSATQEEVLRQQLWKVGLGHRCDLREGFEILRLASRQDFVAQSEKEPSKVERLITRLLHPMPQIEAESSRLRSLSMILSLLHRSGVAGGDILVKFRTDWPLLLRRCLVGMQHPQRAGIWDDRVDLVALSSALFIFAKDRLVPDADLEFQTWILRSYRTVCQNGHDTSVPQHVLAQLLFCVCSCVPQDSREFASLTEQLMQRLVHETEQNNRTAILILHALHAGRIRGCPTSNRLLVSACDSLRKCYDRSCDRTATGSSFWSDLTFALHALSNLDAENTGQFLNFFSKCAHNKQTAPPSRAQSAIGFSAQTLIQRSAVSRGQRRELDHFSFFLLRNWIGHVRSQPSTAAITATQKEAESIQISLGLCHQVFEQVVVSSLFTAGLQRLRLDEVRTLQDYIGAASGTIGSEAISLQISRVQQEVVHSTNGVIRSPWRVAPETRAFPFFIDVVVSI